MQVFSCGDSTLLIYSDVSKQLISDVGQLWSLVVSSCKVGFYCRIRYLESINTRICKGSNPVETQECCVYGATNRFCGSCKGYPTTHTRRSPLPSKSLTTQIRRSPLPNKSLTTQTRRSPLSSNSPPVINHKQVTVSSQFTSRALCRHPHKNLYIG